MLQACMSSSILRRLKLAGIMKKQVLHTQNLSPESAFSLRPKRVVFEEQTATEQQ